MLPSNEDRYGVSEDGTDGDQTNENPGLLLGNPYDEWVDGEEATERTEERDAREGNNNQPGNQGIDFSDPKVLAVIAVVFAWVVSRA